MDKIGRYEIRRTAGRGGMATVYVAFDPHFKREVAVKVMTRELLEDDTFKERFRREAQIIAALEHPAIVTVYDFGEEDRRPYLVMRLMTGGTLADRLQQGPLSIKETAQILDRVGSALERAHQQGIVHRDLKPSNIMFDQYGDAFLADFGIARLTEGAKTLTGQNVIGTPAYMSPEQIHGDQKVDARSDIYALGVICFEMLTGQRPFKETAPMRLMMQHLMDPVPSICAVRPDLPPDLEAVISRTMAKSPDERYEHATDLTDTLDSLAALQPAEASKPEPSQVLGPAVLPPVVTETGEEPAVEESAGSDSQRESVEVERTIPDSAEIRAQAALEQAPETPEVPAQPAAMRAEAKQGTGKWIVLGAAALVILLALVLRAVFFGDQLFPRGQEAPEVAEQPAEVSSAGETANDQEQGEPAFSQEQLDQEEPAAPDLMPTAEVFMGEFYDDLDRGDYSAAEGAVNRAINLLPEEGSFYTEKANLMATVGDFDGAMAAVDTAVDLEPDNAHFYAARGNILRDFGELDAALANNLRAVELNPEDPYLHLDLGMTYMAQEQFEMALEQYNQALEMKHDDPWLYEVRSEALFKLGDYDQGLADLQRAADLDPEGRDFYTRAADIFLNELENPEQALNYYNMAVERSPEDGWVYADRAAAFDALGDRDAALNDLNHAIELMPDESTFYIRRGLLRLDAFEDADGALADLNRAVEIAPDNPDAYAERANFYQYYMEDPEAALADRNRAVELEPDGPWRYVDRALVLRDLGRDEDALVDLDHCLEIAPDYYWCSWERAWIRDTMGEPQAAVEDFHRFLEQAPGDDCPECHDEAERYIQEHS